MRALRLSAGLRAWPIVAAVLLGGCNLVGQAAAPATPTPSQFASDSSRIGPPPTPVVTARATPTVPPPPSTVTPWPTIAPTAEPTRQLVRLAVHEPVRDLAARAVERLNEAPGAYFYALEEPSGAEAAGARLELQISPAGTPVITETMALAVPYGDWRRGLAAAEALAAGYADCGVSAPPEQTPCWLSWRSLVPPLRAVRLDGLLPWEPGYPVWRTWALVGGPAPALDALSPALAEALRPTPPLLLVAVGDIMLDRSLGFRLGRGELDAPFAGLLAELQAGDITVGNLESALGSGGVPAAKRYTFLSPPEAAASLARAGFDLVSLANNHAMDYGPETLLEGIGLLRDQGVASLGAGANEAEAHAPIIVERGGLRLAFLGYANVPVEVGGFDTRDWQAGPDAPGLAWGDPERIGQDVAAAAATADLVVVILHSGYEYIEAPSDEQLAAANAAVEAGADLVIGHHAHLLQGVDFAPGGAILYGLGNFAFTIDGPPETALARIWLDQGGVRQIEWLPAIVQFGGAPRLATPTEAAAILSRIDFLSGQLAWARRHR